MEQKQVVFQDMMGTKKPYMIPSKEDVQTAAIRLTKMTGIPHKVLMEIPTTSKG